jgi:hypothetical protein
MLNIYFYFVLLYLEYKRHKILESTDIYISIFPDKRNGFIYKILKPEYEYIALNNTTRKQYKILFKEKHNSYFQALKNAVEVTNNYLKTLKK